MVTKRAREVELREAALATALGSASCKVRVIAAQRLGALKDSGTLNALRELSESPKEDGKNCGQDEAAEAIRSLKKK